MDTRKAARKKAQKINGIWMRCLQAADIKVTPPTCPTDEQIAQIIEQDLAEETETNSEDVDSHGEQ